MSAAAARLRVVGAVDLHVHVAPDVRPRKVDGRGLAEAARAAGMGGFLLKRHHTSTVAEAAVLGALFPELQIAGGVALNLAVGGLNPAAAEAALRMEAAVVWLPTVDAAHERRSHGEAGGIRLLDGRGRLVAAAEEVLRLVAAHGRTLALGHVSPEEMQAVIAAGRAAGVPRFLVNHPEIAFLDLPEDFQRALAAPDVLFERCFVRANQALGWDALARRIRAVGVDGTVLATDLGQPQNPHPVAGMAEMLARLGERGFSDEELVVMARRNAWRVLGRG